MSTDLVIACSADEHYAMPLAVMLYSLQANLKNKQKQLEVYVLDGGIRPLTKQKVVQSLNTDHLRIHWLQPDTTLLQDLALTRYLTIAAYYRLLLPDVLPHHVEKVIYLDCDMVVRGDLEALWQIDVGDHYVLAVQDDNQLTVSMAIGLRNYQTLGINPDQKYFNSGLLVINLQKWRENHLGRKVLAFSQQNRDFVQDADQDGLNAVIAGQWGQLDPRWNQLPRIYTYTAWYDSPYDEVSFTALRDAPYVIHYTNAPKPWQHGCQHPYTPLFLNYLDQTAWCGWRETIWHRASRKANKGFRKAQKLLRAIPTLVQVSERKG
ncbi:MAG: glycosyltransferase family 8 protein [Leptolyngbya sp. BL-A-14]